MLQLASRVFDIAFVALMLLIIITFLTARNRRRSGESSCGARV